MNEFNEIQLVVIRDFAVCYFNNMVAGVGLDESVINRARVYYIESIIAGLQDPNVWP